jgi:NAD(P)-dependent dehydrogenase (short-subunit alcohol dehydrogenase family)
MDYLRGKVVLITGASRGIGASAARAFAKAGAHVGLAARESPALAALADELGGGAATPIPCDVADFGSVARAVTTLQKAQGRLDVLVNNAGVIEPIAPLATADPETWARLIDINLTGAFNGYRAALPVMIAQKGGGTIITIGSGAAVNPLEGWSAYCASKAGALMLTRIADIESRGDGIRALSLSPGTVATDMQATIRDSGVNRVSQLDWSEHIPPEWAARALVWMCGPEANPWLGQEVSLRDEALRRRIGLV